MHVDRVHESGEGRGQAFCAVCVLSHRKILFARVSEEGVGEGFHKRMCKKYKEVVDARGREVAIK
jgi:hypothetical protein